MHLAALLPTSAAVLQATVTRRNLGGTPADRLHAATPHLRQHSALVHWGLAVPRGFPRPHSAVSVLHLAKEFFLVLYTVLNFCL